MSYNHQLVKQMPACLTLEENIELLPLVAAGDADARRQMIEGNMAFALSKVDAYLHIFPHYEYLRDDLTSAAFIGLVGAMDTIKTGATLAYIGIAIVRALGELVESEETVRVPGRTQRRAVAIGKPISKPGVTNIPVESLEGEERVRAVALYHNLSKASEIERLFLQQGLGSVLTETDSEAVAASEMRDLIQSCCECDEERTYVEMREAGYKLREIAEAINMPLSSTHVMKEELYAKVKAKAELQ